MSVQYAGTGMIQKRGILILGYSREHPLKSFLMSGCVLYAEQIKMLS